MYFSADFGAFLPLSRNVAPEGCGSGSRRVGGEAKTGEMDLFGSTSVTKLGSGSLVIVIETRVCCSPHGLAQFQFLVLF